MNKTKVFDKFHSTSQTLEKVTVYGRAHHRNVISIKGMCMQRTSCLYPLLTHSQPQRLAISVFHQLQKHLSINSDQYSFLATLLERCLLRVFILKFNSLDYLLNSVANMLREVI